MNHREAAYALLRVTLGVVLLFFGIGKFMAGISNFVGGMNQRFAGKLPAIMVMPFASAIPFCEVIAGLLILFGLFTRLGLVLFGLLIIGLTFGTVILTFGTVILGDAPTGPTTFNMRW
jgi:thiosulfate dehydrogenase (quinone) large subunit